MRFEEAIAEMRNGKRCKRKMAPGQEYFIQDGRIQFSDSGLSILLYCTDWLGLNDDWSIVEPPPPLPRLFRAKYKGGAVAGAEFPHEGRNRYRCTNGCWLTQDCLTNLEYIDANQ